MNQKLRKRLLARLEEATKNLKRRKYTRKDLGF
jgi:hypothetical protein